MDFTRHHVYLIEGPSKSGKTSMACNLVRLLKQVHPQRSFLFSPTFEYTHLLDGEPAHNLEDFDTLVEIQKHHPIGQTLIVLLDDNSFQWAGDLFGFRHVGRFRDPDFFSAFPRQKIVLVVCTQYLPSLPVQLRLYTDVYVFTTVQENKYSVAIMAGTSWYTYHTKRFTRPESKTDWAHFRLVFWHSPPWSRACRDTVHLVSGWLARERKF